MNATASTRAILFADVSGSSRLYETLGDAAALATVEHCLALAKSATLTFGGRVVKTIGDEVMACFGGPLEAAQAAVDMQRRVASTPAGGCALPAMRIGVHFGPVIEEQGDVFGDSVNTAARVTALAKGGQILTTPQVFAALPAGLQARARPLDVVTVPGKREDIPIFEVLWQDSAEEVTVILTRRTVSVSRLRIAYLGREIVLDADRPGVALGRDPSNDLVIMAARASRLHARIARRRDKFVLIDASTNGTYVAREGEAEILVRREELVLRGRGRMSFGEPMTDPNRCLSFACEG